MKPEEVLDLDLWQVYAYLDGYKVHMRDISALPVATGYWAAYYVGTKHPKKPDEILNASKKTPQERQAITQEDIRIFEEREKRRLRR